MFPVPLSRRNKRCFSATYVVVLLLFGWPFTICLGWGLFAIHPSVLHVPATWCSGAQSRFATPPLLFFKSIDVYLIDRVDDSVGRIQYSSSAEADLVVHHRTGHHHRVLCQLVHHGGFVGSVSRSSSDWRCKQLSTSFNRLDLHPGPFLPYRVGRIGSRSAMPRGDVIDGQLS